MPTENSPSSPSVIYLAINLEDAEDRRRSLLHQAEAFGLQLQIVSAVSGKQLTPEQRARYDEAQLHRFYNYSLSDNEKACTLSHHRALGEFLQSDADYAVVLEDDAQLQPHFNEALHELINHLRGWDVAKLHLGNGIRTIPLMRPRAAAPIEPVFSSKLSSVSVAFLYTRRAAEIIHRELSTFWLPTDSQIFQIILDQNLRIIGVEPEAVKLMPCPSTIDSSAATHRKKPGKRTLMQYLRHRLRVWDNSLRKIYLYLCVRIKLGRM